MRTVTSSSAKKANNLLLTSLSMVSAPGLIQKIFDFLSSNGFYPRIKPYIDVKSVLDLTSNMETLLHLA